MKDFLDWLFELDTPGVFPVLFCIGCLSAVFTAFITAFFVHPVLGIVFVVALTVGVPYVAYRMRGK